MKIARTVLLPVILLASSLLHAHTQLEKALPADGAVMHVAPAALELGFTEEVQLLKFAVALDSGTPVTIAFKPEAAAHKTFSIPLPTLAPAVYKVSWTVLGKDGHRVEGSLGFSVNPQAKEVSGTAPAQNKHDHH